MVKLQNKDTLDRLIEYAEHCLNGGLVIDKENKAALNQIVMNFDAGHGLLLLGRPGSGKTLIMSMLQRITNPQLQNIFSKASSLELVRDFCIEGHEVFTRWDKLNVFFDDLGFEKQGVHFGDRIEVMEQFIAFRYELFQKHKLVTHFTSNLNHQQIADRYGERCVSRLREMTETIVLGSGSDYTDRRKLKNFITLPHVDHPRILSEDQLEFIRRYNEAKKKAQENPYKANEQKKGGFGTRLKNHLIEWEQTARSTRQSDKK